MSSLRTWRLDSGVTQEQLSIESKVPRYKLQLAEQGVAVLSREEFQRIMGVLTVPKPDQLVHLIKPIDGLSTEGGGGNGN